MVAPTPTSALLHSSTMVKAGVFLIIKLAPVLGLNGVLDFTSPGFLCVMIGGITFLIASFQAISQSNAKRVLAYSTVSNLGLIIACAGIGTQAAVWAAIFLTIFHAVTKSLLFLLVGTAEHNIGSRDIESFDGLFDRMPKLAICMVIGISAMYLAPFGMLLSKWAALESFLSGGNPVIILILAFGSATTLFYWTKWLGKMISVVSGMKRNEFVPNKIETAVHMILATLVGLVCITFPLISKAAVVPYLTYASGASAGAPLGDTNFIIMVIMVVIIILLPILFYGRSKKAVTNIYLAGANEGDNRTFKGAMGKDVQFELRNWYMDKTFNEGTMKRIGNIETCIIIALSFSNVFMLGFYILKALVVPQTGGF
jgi:ech hydrogenase subunit A